MIKIKDEVISLINSKREDDYWDFKQCFHDNKADLLHDIICMANNRSNHDGYIIFGVEDKTFNVLGVKEDINRKNQQNIIDFLKEKPFSMNIRPKIQLVTFEIEKNEIDVLIVHNTTDTPYYLVNDYKEQSRNVRANYIYTRVGDTNTDINRSADSNHVEYLWKKRFGLHLSPFEKLRYHLQEKDSWSGSESICYHNLYPEYTLSEMGDEDNHRAEFYAYAMTNESTSYGMISANYFGTTLYSRQTVSLDSGRYTTVVPEWGFIHYDKYHQTFDPFKYFIKDSISYDLHLFLLNEKSEEALCAYKSFMEIVLLFENKKEKDDFICYIESNLESLKNNIAILGDCYDYLPLNSPEKEQVIRRLRVGIVLKKMQHQFDKIRLENK
ncbi:ATP-binding protein [Listeria grandensis]|uniref:ATP-binding protein n=1 Tax=Listeria grandensis TaxID=1494963 RepID=UPI00164D9E33|nr:ATP-binding protein [Listeria grandensis]MBC6315716.1 ATP-binding protein [Listeria grandensis]